jgi:hypothetical protein
MRIGSREVAIENKVLILLNASESLKGSLVEESKDVAAEVLRRLDSPTRHATVMSRFDVDPFTLASKAPGYDVTIELHADVRSDELASALEGIADFLPSARPGAAASVVLVGSDYVFRPCVPQAIRFQYVMRRRADLTHEAYVRYYAEVHSVFGYKTRGVRGYAQLHVDPHASEKAVKLSGLGTCDFDGVSQLHMASLFKFLLAAPINGAMGMVKDERRFVDRDNSAMFSSRVIAYSEY